MFANLVPKCVCENAREHRQGKDNPDVHPIGSCQGSSSQKQGNRGKGQASLLQQNPNKKHGIAVPNEKLDSSFHFE
jgi:hypothetical protein